MSVDLEEPMRSLGFEPVELCGMHSRSNWPVWHYDGRWECSMPKGHKEEFGTPHAAFINHDPKWGYAWVQPWVDDPDPED